MELITLDGPAGSGKSTVAKALAQHLGYYFLSTGTLYRAVAWHLTRQGWNGALPLPLHLMAGFAVSIDAQAQVWVAGHLATDLGSGEISTRASLVSQAPSVREQANQLQRDVVQQVTQAGTFPGMVIEGRDSGTVVFPQARHKFFVTAPDEIRAQRRLKELLPRQPNLTLAQVLQEVRARDHQDETRALAPLKPAPDAVWIDTGNLDIQGVVNEILKHLAPPAA